MLFCGNMFFRLKIKCGHSQKYSYATKNHLSKVVFVRFCSISQGINFCSRALLIQHKRPCIPVCQL